MIEAHLEDFSQIDSLDNGKPINEARFFDVPFTVDMLRYFAGWPTKITGDTIPISFPASFGDSYHAYTLREPIGVVGAIAPWNLPLLSVVKKLAPALAAGCTIVIKPAEQTPLSIALLAQLALEAGIPEGVVNFVTGYGEEAGEALVRHPGVDKISFTGSSEIGKLIVRNATGTLKRVSLELGGKSRTSCSPTPTSAAAIQGACMAGFRLPGRELHRRLAPVRAARRYYDEIVAGDHRTRKSLKIGPGLDTETRWDRWSPQEQLRSRVSGTSSSAASEGAEIVTGGGRWGNDGYFIEPTVHGQRLQRHAGRPRGDLRPGDNRDAVRHDEEQVLEAANDTRFGLGAAVWTRTSTRAHRMAAALESGQVWVNCYQACDSALPFGGYKESGWGRETCRETMDEYTELKTVVVNLGPTT